MNVVPLHPVESKAEQLALELANMLAADGKLLACATLSAYVDEHKHAHWEAIAIADMATCMQHGRRWKKD